MNASANSVAVASPEVPTRMLNGGISLSAIFIAGQLKPQARLTATSIKRAEESADCCGEADGTLRVPVGREERKACVAPSLSARARAAGRQKRRSPGHFVMLHRSWRCVTQPRDFRGAPALSAKMRSPMNPKGLEPTVRDGAEPSELPKEHSRGRRRRNRIRHGGPLRDRAVRSRPLRSARH